MSCVNPLFRTDSGRIFSLKSVEDPQFRIWTENGKYLDTYGDIGQIIRCGSCIGCRTDHAKEWSDRIIMESSLWPENWFVTLTFDDEYLVKECGLEKTIKVEHVQKFMKRLRKEVCKFSDGKIRMFACGEYGSLSERPHYHLILFNLHLPVDGLHFLRQTKQGNDLFSSDLISKCWPFGFNTCGSVTFQSAGYVARYTLKKIYGQEAKKVYEASHRKAPFLLMSRRPGIGYDYMVNHDWDNEPNILVSDGEESHMCPVPEYMERYIRKTDPELADQRQAIKRRLAFETSFVKQSQTTLNISEYAEQMKGVLENRTNVLTNRDNFV